MSEEKIKNFKIFCMYLDSSSWLVGGWLY